MPTSIEECPIPCVTVDTADLTVGAGTLTGTGVFDVLVQAAKVHLVKEHTAGRIAGNQYAEAYIAMMGQSMQTAAGFTLAKDRVGFEIDSIIKQRELVEEQIQQIVAQTELTRAQTIKLSSVDTDLTIEQVETQKEQTSQVTAQTSMIGSQEASVLLEAVNIPKQGLVLDEQLNSMLAQTALVQAQTVKLSSVDTDLTSEQILTQIQQTGQVAAQTSMVETQELNVVAEGANIPKQGLILDEQLLTMVAETNLKGIQGTKLAGVDTQLVTEQISHSQAQTSMVETQEINVVAEGLNIPKQGAILDEQLLTMEAETRLKDIQGIKLAGPDTDLIEQQIIQSVSNITLTEEQIKILEKQQGFQPMR